MIYQFQEHNVVALGTKQRIFGEAFKEPLFERFGWKNTISSGIIGYVGREDIFDVFSALAVTNIAVKSVITNSLESLWQDVLYHSSDELYGREGFMLDLARFMVVIPVADGFTIIFFDSAYRDRRRDDVLCQIFGQSFSTGRHVTRLQKSDKALGIICPCFVDIFLDGRIVNLFLEHFQKVMLPLSVHQLVGDVRDRFPLSTFIDSSSGHEDVEMRVVMSGTSGSLQYDNVSDVKIGVGASIEDVFETGMSCPHERTEQFWVAKEPGTEEFRHCQYDMAIGYARQQPSSDEIRPSVSIALGTGKTEAGFTGEGNAAYLSTGAASVLHKAHLFLIAAAEHLVDSLIIVWTVKAWSKLLKRIPVIVKNLLECVLINAFHGCSLRTTITEMAKQVEKRVENALC